MNSRTVIAVIKVAVVFTSARMYCNPSCRGAPVPDLARYPVNLVGSDPDPAGSNVSGSGLHLDPARAEVGSSKYWLALHNHGIKHHSMFSFQEMTHYNTEVYMKTR